MKFSEHFDITRGRSDDWFDPDLSVDTKLFLDPFLLLDEASRKGSMWSSAHSSLIEHFARCYDLLAKAGATGTLSERTARSLLSFPEPAELCLGYTASGTAGSGSGRRNAALIIGSIVTAIAAGLDRPEHIEEIGILNEGVGADRISDAACNVLKPTLITYTQAVARRHEIVTEKVRVRRARCNLDTGRWFDEDVELPVNPFTDHGVLLVPKRFLNHLPTLNADDWFASTFNDDLRHDLNVHIGKRVPKAEIVKAARQHPERIRQWADALRQSGDVRGYNFAGDPLGLVSWQDAGAKFAEANPLTVSVGNQTELAAFVKDVLKLYKHFIEQERGWKLLWNDDDTEKPEEAAQLALLGLARPYCRAHGVELDREVNLGRGPVDFKLSGGPSLRLLIEVKKLHNGDFWNGLEHQLPSYMVSDQTQVGWLLAIRYRTDGVSKSRARELPSRVRKVNGETGMNVSFSLVDARHKPSASRIRGATG